MNNSQVAHIWAQRDGGAAHGSNMFFDNDIIYSFGTHFPMARHIDDNVVLFTTHTWGFYTARHLSLTADAIRHKTVFHVPDVLARCKSQHRDNYKDYLERLKGLGHSLLRARKRGAAYLRQMQRLTDEANAYSKYFKLGYKSLTCDLSEIEVKYAKTLAAEKAAAKREAEKRRKEAEKELQDWLTGEKRGNLYGLPFNYLRVKPSNPEVIQTTGGAEVPREHAVNAWPLIKACCEKGREFVSNGRKIRVGHFTIDKITTDGVVHAGCHKFQYSELKRLADVLGLD